MMYFETESYLLNEAYGGDALAIDDHMLMAFDGVSSTETKGSETRDAFLTLIDQGKSVEETIRSLIQQQRHDTTLALAKLTPDKLEIYRIGDSRVRVHDEGGNLVYETPDQNFMAEIQLRMGLIKSFYERPEDEILRDILGFPEIRERFTRICNEHLIEGITNIFEKPSIRKILQFLEMPEQIPECCNEISRLGYSPTLLRIIYTNAPQLLSYSLAIPESMAFIKPVKVLEPKPGYRIVVGTDGVFSNLHDRIINTVVQQKSLRLATRGLIVEANRRKKTKLDMSSAIGKITAA